MAAEAAHKVVVILDASSEVSWDAIKWALQGLPLKPGDELILVGILHQVNDPSTLSFMGAGKFLGYRIKVDSNWFGANQKIVEEETAKRKEEYLKNVDSIAKQCEIEKIGFRIEVVPGPLPKIVAVKAARELRATWVILDRQMKKDRKYFMDKLSCKISRMKRDNTIEDLRGPKTIGITQLPPERTPGQINYGEIIPGSPENNSSKSKEQSGDGAGEPPGINYSKSSSFSKSSSSKQLMFSSTVSSSSMGNTEASSSSFTEAKYSFVQYPEEDNNTTTNTEQETVGEQSPFFVSETQERTQKEAYNTGSSDEQQKQHNSNNDWMGRSQTDEVFDNSVCSFCKNRRPKIGWKRDFTYAELQAATEGFSLANFLSEDGFGSVYRGELKNGPKIAVKQHKNASCQGEKEFKSEVNALSTARHKNLVMLLGSCSEGSHRLLVYEYVCFGSLDQHLSKHSRRPLSWEKRMKIAMGAAQGLTYLHKSNIIHRDMRPDNILVTHDHESMLGDFGFERKHGESDQSSEMRMEGTLGYLAPEYAESWKVSTKTDVYAFGVVLLQLITGLKTTDKILGGKSLVGWARPLLKEKNYPDLIDHRIIDSHDVHQLFWMVRVAEKCLCKDPHKRLTMETVVSALQYIIEGNTVSFIRNFSPAPDSAESQGTEGPTEQETGTTPITSTTTTDDIASTSNSSKSTQMSTGLVVSPPLMPNTLSSSSCSSSSRRSALSIPADSSGRPTLPSGKKRQTPRRRNELLYNEMVISNDNC